MKCVRISAWLLLGLLCACHGTTSPTPPYTGIKLGRPYEIYGHWYEPQYDAQYDETGVASWYGPGFHGGHTASGERFDQNALTAAHKTLPLPSIVRVTNLDNGLSAIIRINDRGPFSHDRIIDLSRGSAEKLGVIRTGTAHVRVQFLERETRAYVRNLQQGTEYAMNGIDSVNPDEAGDYQEAATKPSFHVRQRLFPDDKAAGLKTPEPAFVAPAANESPAVSQPSSIAGGVPGGIPSEFSVVDNTEPQTAPPPQQHYLVQPSRTPYGNFAAPHPHHAAPNYFVQAGTFGIRANALNLLDRLSDTDTPQIMEIVMNGKKFYRVMVGPYEEQGRAKNMLSKLASIGIADAKIIRN